MICCCLALDAAAFLIAVCCYAQESRDAKAKDRRLLEAIEGDHGPVEFRKLTLMPGAGGD
jgi:hypothetical protein